MDSGFIEGFRLSPQQRRLWMARRDAADAVSRAVLRLEGDLDRAALDRALADLTGRHEILCTSYRCLPGMDLPIQVLGGDAAVRFEVVPSGPREHRLTVALPAASADDRSLCNLFEEIATAYGAQVSGGPSGDETEPEGVQYADFSEWQNEMLEESGAEARRDFWRRQRRGSLAVRWPSFARPSSGDEEPETLSARRDPDPALAAAVEAFATRHRASVPVVLFAAWRILLSRLLEAADVAVGWLADGRRFPQLEGALGRFARHLPIDVGVEPDFLGAEVVEMLRAAVEEAEQHQEHFLWEDYAGEGVEGALPVLFEVTGTPAPREAGGVRFVLAERRVEVEPADLRLSVRRGPEGIGLELTGRPGLLPAGEAGRWLARLEALLCSLIANPGLPVADLDPLGEDEKGLLAGWSRTVFGDPGDLPDLPVHRLFERQAESTPEAVAVVAGPESLTYAELEARANRLARLLGRHGLVPGGLLGIALERSADQIAALLAAWKAGAAFVPLDPGQPRQRLQRMVEDLAAVGDLVVVTRGASCDGVAAAGARLVDLDAEAPGREPPTPPGLPADADAPAYLLFTSGSTGRPKGAVIRHRSVANLAAALERSVYAHHRGGAPLRVSVNAPLVFDASIKQIVRLLAGDALYLVPEEVRRDGEALLAFVRERRLDVLDSTPSQLRLLLDAGLLDGEGPRLALIGGEAIDRELWSVLAAQERTAFYNVYGPTECTVDTTAERIGPGMSGILPSLGRPLLNVEVHLLDPGLDRAPAGLPGELCIGGAGLALGYAGLPGPTAERFVPHPFPSVPGERLYRSGDLARHLADGRLEFLGRRDHQVKVRGYRLELGEIEAALAEHPGVRQAAVLARDGQGGGPRLVAYVERRGSASRSLQGAAGAARHALPNGLRVHAMDGTETDYLFHEIFRERIYLRHGIRLPEDGVVFDVGANIGLFSLFVAQEAPRARLFAFEPIPAVLEALRGNAALHFPRARLFPFGLADREDAVHFTYYPQFSSRSGLAAYSDRDNDVEVTRRHMRNTWGSGGSGGAGDMSGFLVEMDDLLGGRFVAETVEARVRRLADVVREEGIERIDLLKIDVQRAELDVLRGLDEETWRRVEQVVMEVHDEAGGPTAGRLAEITGLLESRGFEVLSEQDDELQGTDRHNLFASRRGLARGASSPVPVSAAPAGEATASDLRAFLAERLPEPMLPAEIVFLEKFPYTRGGKIDRLALPAPEELRETLDRPLRAPRTAVEEVLASIFAGVLGIERLGIDDSFFDLGGHSLLATQLVARVRGALRVDLPLRALFEAPTVESLAPLVTRALESGRGLSAPPIEPVLQGAEGVDLPLSFAQESLWFLHQLNPGSASYNSSWVLRVEGRLDAGLVDAVITEVVRRHAVLRTTFPAADGAGRPVQRIAPPAPVRLAWEDLGPLPEPERIEEARRRAAEIIRQPFDLAAGPLLRGALLRLGDGEHVLVLVIHHIACDGWSLSVLQREVAALYEAFAQGLPSPLPEPALQYADFAHWQRRWMQGRVLADHLDYWKSRLAGAPPETGLPRDGAPADGTSQRSFRLPADLAAGLHALGRRHGATLYMTLLAAFSVLLARSSGQEDVVVGTAVAGRERTETEGLIGLFLNMLPIRLDLAGGHSFADLLAQVREVTLEAYMYQGLPFERLVGELPQARSAGRNPVFQVAFGLQNLPWQPFELPGLRLTPWEVGHDEVRLDLTVWMSESPEGLRADWTWDPAILGTDTVERWQARFGRLLAAAVASPESSILDLEMLSEEEQRELDERKRHRETANLARLRSVQRRSVGPA